MKFPSAFLLTAFCLSLGAQCASALDLQKQGETVVLKPGQAIVIDNALGDVRLRFGGKKHQLDFQSVAQGSKNQAAPKASFSTSKSSSDPITLSTRMKPGEVANQGERIDVSAFIPEGHAVSVRTSGGLVEARGLQSDIKVVSESGEVILRGIVGAIDAQTKGGDIQAPIESSAKAIKHRFVSDTGQITLSLAGDINASLEVSTSGLFGTEFSLQVTELPGQEPNKIAQLKLGPQDSPNLNQIQVLNKRGQIRIFRRREFNVAD